MKTIFLNQRAGADCIGEELITLLAEKRFHHVKFLMAYVSEPGLAFLKNSLEAFYDRKGILEFIIGIDQGVTTHGALDYLKRRFPKASLFLFHDEAQQITFHPKVVICESDRKVVCIVGSANLTLGGLFTNCECGVLIELDKKKDGHKLKDILGIWDAYRNPMPPFEPNHLQELTKAWLKVNAKILLKSNASARTKTHGDKFKGFGKVNIKTPKVPALLKKPKGSLKKPKGSSGGKGDSQFSAGRRLYLEVMKETGAGGTQVQIPVDAVTEFFKGDVDESQLLRLTFDNKTFKDAHIHHFENNTHRMSINEVASMKRPLLIRFRKLPHFPKTYYCKLITGNDYKVAVKKCNRQTRDGAKRWRIENQ